MGYTINKGKFVIWTCKIFVAEKYPFQDDGENVTFFYKKLKDSMHFEKCPARLSDKEKIKLVSTSLNIPENKIVLRSKKSHHKQKRPV